MGCLVWISCMRHHHSLQQWHHNDDTIVLCVYVQWWQNPYKSQWNYCSRPHSRDLWDTLFSDDFVSHKAVAVPPLLSDLSHHESLHCQSSPKSGLSAFASTWKAMERFHYRFSEAGQFEDITALPTCQSLWSLEFGLLICGKSNVRDPLHSRTRVFLYWCTSVYRILENRATDITYLEPKHFQNLPSGSSITMV